MRAGRLMGGVLTLVWLTADSLAAGPTAPPAEKVLQGADWELRTLGVTGEPMLQWVRAMARRRPVTLAVVGEGGVSEAELAPLLAQGNTLEYRDGASDPNAGTHDTGQLRLILDQALRLGVRLHVLVYQPPDDFAAVGEALARAGAAADIVVCFHSFWGGDVVGQMAERVRQASTALFVAPYGEIGEPRTGTSWQAYAAKPDGGGVPNFVTCIPLAQRSPGELLHPSARDAADTETINYVAPSYYANGPGGTCPAAATTAAVSAFIVAASTRKPTPPEITQLLRDTATVDRAALTSVAEVDDPTVDRLETEIARLVDPARNGGQRKLEAAGVLSLRGIYRRLVDDSLPPPTRRPPGVMRPMQPRAQVLDDRVELGNAHLGVTLTTSPALSMSRLFSKHTLGACLAGGQTSHLFAVAADDRLLTSDQFRQEGDLLASGLPPVNAHGGRAPLRCPDIPVPAAGKGFPDGALCIHSRHPAEQRHAAPTPPADAPVEFLGSRTRTVALGGSPNASLCT